VEINNSGLISLIEAGSGYDPEKPLDPGLLRYRTSIYPEQVGVELLIRDLEQFRSLAKFAEPRLRPFLLEIAYSMDCALASKSSEGGKMLDMINTAKSMQSFWNHNDQKKKGDPLDRLNDAFGDMTNPNNSTDYGNKKY
jgi:hypothetical protein